MHEVLLLDLATESLVGTHNATFSCKDNVVAGFSLGHFAVADCDALEQECDAPDFAAVSLLTTCCQICLACPYMATV